MRRLHLGKDFEKESELDVERLGEMVVHAEGTVSTKTLRPKRGCK